MAAIWLGLSMEAPARGVSADVAAGAALEAAGPLLEAWADGQFAPWPARPVAAAAEVPRARLAAQVDTRWSLASPAVRAAYAGLAYVRALKSDDWHLLSSLPGAPATDAYFSALTAPLGRSLLVVDDLRRLVDLTAREDRPAPPAAATQALRDTAAAASSLGSLAQLLPPALRLTAPTPASSGGEIAQALPLPAVRSGADLALVLPLVALAAAPAPGVPTRVTVVLHLQGLPLLEAAFPGEALARFRSGALGLMGLWQAGQLVDFTGGLPLAPRDFLLTAAEVPAGAKCSPPVEVAAAQARDAAGVAEQIAARGAALQELALPEGKLRLVALVTEGEAGKQSAGSAWTQGPVAVWVTGPAGAVDDAVAHLGRCLPSPEQPRVDVPPPVRAVLEPGTWPPAPRVACCLQRLVICRSVDEQGQPVGAGTTFPATTRQVGVWFETAGAPPQTTLLVHWYVNGKMLHYHEALKVVGKVTKFVSLSAGEGKSLPAGDWRVDLYQNGVKVQEHSFRIG